MITNLVRKISPTFGYDLPAREAFLANLQKTKFTPDIAKLEEYEWQSLFVPDELKKDHFKHHLLGDAEYCFPAFTQKNFYYWESTDPTEGAIPLQTDSLQAPVVGWPPIAKIKGEVYLIRPQQFLEIDPYKQNTVEYVRQRTRLIVPYRKIMWVKDKLGPDFYKFFSQPEQYFNNKTFTSEEHVYIVKSWMYHGKEEYWGPRINAWQYGPAEHYYSKNRRWLDQYYHIRRPQLPPKLPG